MKCEMKNSTEIIELLDYEDTDDTFDTEHFHYHGIIRNFIFSVIWIAVLLISFAFFYFTDHIDTVFNNTSGLLTFFAAVVTCITGTIIFMCSDIKGFRLLLLYVPCSYIGVYLFTVSASIVGVVTNGTMTLTTISMTLLSEIINTIGVSSAFIIAEMVLLCLANKLDAGEDNDEKGST